MADIQHKDIPDSERHEPKGISSASAETVYVANGSGSGEWKTPETLTAGQGWGHYQHSLTGQVIDATYQRLEIDGLGANTEESFLPREIRGNDSLWFGAVSQMTPITLGDSYDIRLDIPVTSETGTVNEVTIQLDIGTSVIAPTIPIVTRFAAGGRTTPYVISIAFPIFCLATFVANGGRFFIKTDAGTATLGSPAITIVRTFAGDS